MTEMSAENNKHIVLCVDQTPSMNYKIQSGTIMEAVNQGVEAFVSVFNGKDVNANLTVITFDTAGNITMPPESAIKKFVPQFSVRGGGKAWIADALKKAAERLAAYENGYVILISDGLVEPDEEESQLSDAIEKLNKYCCYAVGFSSENNGSPLHILLDYFTNKQLKSFSDRAEYVDTLKKIAGEIIEDKVKVDYGADTDY